MPHLHNKTHFKAATTFTLAYPENFYCPNGKNMASKSSDRQAAAKRMLFNSFKNMENAVSRLHKFFSQESNPLANKEKKIKTPIFPKLLERYLKTAIFSDRK